jgi:RimJ/RimL family protein N-acetyltransferase
MTALRALNRIDLRAPYYLTPFDPQRDIDEVVQAFNDLRVTENLAGPAKLPYTREDAESFFDKNANSKYKDTVHLFWCIRDGDGRCIGSIEVRPSELISTLRANIDRFMDLMSQPRPGQPFCAFGFWLHPDHRGQEIMTQAIDALVENFCKPIGVKLLIGDSFVGNWASRRTFEKSGFSYVGIAPKVFTKPITGVVYDLWVYRREL